MSQTHLLHDNSIPLLGVKKNLWELFGIKNWLILKAQIGMEKFENISELPVPHLKKIDKLSYKCQWKKRQKIR